MPTPPSWDRWRLGSRSRIIAIHRRRSILLSKGEWRQESGSWHMLGIGSIVYDPHNIVHTMRSSRSSRLPDRRRLTSTICRDSKNVAECRIARGCFIDGGITYSSSARQQGNGINESERRVRWAGHVSQGDDEHASHVLFRGIEAHLQGSRRILLVDVS